MKKTTHRSSTAGARARGAFPMKPLAAWFQHPVNWSLLAGALPAVAFAQVPTGGTVAAGSASINAVDANHLQIQQASNKAVLNWQKFSIGDNDYVQFAMPNRSAIALNRVIGSDPSSILGHLSSNGQIFLVNPNGVFFGANSVVDVAGIVATTMNISDADFMRGDYRFTRDANTPENATVINAGSINANGGYIVLVGDYAANRGVMQAQLGTALLASGSSLTLQLAGSSLINYAVDQATVAHLAGVSNSGQILANGGRVIMTADVAHDLASTVVNNSGLIQAQSMVSKDGAVYLGGQGGDVANSGVIDASAQAGANGGHVEIRASGDISHEAGSKITASGADTGVSSAGSVTTWADGTNRYKAGAQIEARGGAEGGNGGQVELSGNKVLDRSVVDLSAPNGELGTLLLDPGAITIADGAGTDAGDQSTVYEQNVENQLKSGNLTLSATGPDASITLANLSDGALDGTNGGNGGSLTLSASGSGNPTIKFANAANTIKVDRGITIAVDDGAASNPGNAVGSLDLGNLQAGTAIDLKAGAIQTGKLSIDKSISTSTDTSYSIDAHAYAGDLKVNGDVALNVSNDTAAAVGTDVKLTASSDVNVTGAISSNATGKGYHNYNWTTAGNDAPTYLGAQPWTMQTEADHPVTANLAVQAGGKVTVGSTIDVLATDVNTDFADKGIGGYWQTATATQHNFWRPTAAQATASVNASGDVSVGGKIAVDADGYATAQYSETEYWRTMVDNFNYTSGTQAIYTNVCDSNNVCSYQHTSDYTATNLKGSATGNYIWVFGPYTNYLPATSNNSPTYTQTSDSSSDSAITAMRYTGARGLNATLDINAGGSVSLNGMSVLVTNRSGTGGSSFTDVNWGHQDTAAGLNGTGNSFTSGSRETDYKDNFDTSFTAATANATANITAGDNQAVNLHGGDGVAYDVIASHPNLNASGNTLASAGMTITAGAAGGASGAGRVTLDGPIHVEGADDAVVGLTVLNHDGDIAQAADNAAIVVKNNYSGHDAQASFTSDSGNVTLDDVAVSAGRNAEVDAVANQYLAVTGAISAVGPGGQAVVNMNGNTGVTADSSVAASGSSLASIAIASSAGGVTTNGALSATASGQSGSATIALNGASDVTASDATAQAVGYGYQIGYPNHINTGGTAQITMDSTNGDIALNGDVNANAHKSANVGVTASNGALSSDAGKQISATSSNSGQASDLTYASDIDLTSATGMTVDGSLTASAGKGNATVELLTTGGTDASLVQGSGSTITATGNTAGVTANAGNPIPAASNAAAVALGGNTQALATSGAAGIAVNGKAGSINNFSASSGGNVASVTTNAYNGDLTLDGTGSISGNYNSASGAGLTAAASGKLDTSAATLTVNNINAGLFAGANAVLTAGNDGATLGSASVGTAGNGAAAFTATVGGDLSTAGALSATGHAGAVTVALSSSSGNLSLANDVTASGNNGATVSATATTGTLVQSAGTVLASTTNGTAATTITSGDTMMVGGTVSASAINGAANATLVSNAAPVEGAALTLDGNVSAISVNGDATSSVSTTGDNAAMMQASTSTIKAAGGDSAHANVASIGAMTIDGSIIAAATSDGTVTGMHTGSALVDIGTTGGSTATITQGSTGTVMAAGVEARVNVTAGDSDPSAHTTQAAAFDLGGAMQALDTIGGSILTVGGASGSVHDFSVTAGAAPATATITAYNGDLTLDGTGNANGNNDSASGASLTATAAGKLDASAATLTVSNSSIGASAGATADLTATNGTAQLGSTSVSTAGNGAAALTATASGDLSTAGNVSATGNTGTATVAMSSTSGNLGLANDVTATSNSGSTVSATATNGTLSQTAGTILASTTSGTAATTLTSNEAMTLDGTVATRAVVGTANTSVGTTGDSAAMTQGNTGAIEAAGGNSAYVDVASTGAMGLNGSIVAAATNDGTLTGAHTGSALIDIGTSGGNSASITQGSAGTVNATGAQARVSVTAGDSDPSGHGAQAAAFDLAGSLQAIDSLGGATLEIGGASGTVHDFSVTAGAAPAAATINAYDGNLTLDGTGNVSGNYGSASGASLTATASGALDASNATLTVNNNNNGSSAGASAALTASNGSAQLGATSVGTAGNGAAALTASASGDLSTAGNLSATGSNGTATVGLSSSSGNLSLANDLTASGNGSATVSATATAGTLSQTAGTVLATASTGPATASLSSNGAMTVDGTVSANAIDGTASVAMSTTGGNAASVTQGAGSVVQAVGSLGSSVTMLAGAGNLDDLNANNAAALDLHGALRAGFDGSSTSDGASTLTVAGKSGTVGDFTARSNNDSANAAITAYNGDLNMVGTDSVIAAGDATATLAATAGALTTGDAAHGISVSTSGSDATLNAAGSAGLTVGGELAATATGANGMAGIALSSSSGDIALNRNLTAVGRAAGVTASADNGSLTQAAGTTSRAGATAGSATVDFTSNGAMSINGDIVAAATSDGTTSGEHSGFAQVKLRTTGGAGAGISQDGASTMTAVGSAARMTVVAGAAGEADPAAAFNLAGTSKVLDMIGGSTLDIQGGSGTVHDFTVSAANAPATATITTYGGDLTLDGTGNVNGNYNSASGASLTATAAGSLDASNATLTVSNNSTGSSAGAKIALAAGNGSARLGSSSVGTAGNGDALIVANASGDLSTGGSVSATGNNGSADVALASSSGNVSLGGDVAATGATAATVAATATAGMLSQAGGTVLATAATGPATVSFGSAGAMTIGSNVSANAVDGLASIALATTGGSSASITQGVASTLLATGQDGSVSINAGASAPDSGSAAAVALNGDLQARATSGTAGIQVNGRSGSIRNFSASSSGGGADVGITTYNGALTLNGAGSVNGNADAVNGANLALTSAGALDAANAALAVVNGNSGDSAGAQVALSANNGNMQLGPLAVSASGGGQAAILAAGTGAITVSGNLSSVASGNGSALLKLSTTGNDAAGTVTQNAGMTMQAASAMGDATVAIKAPGASVNLNGDVAATVVGGAGSGTVQVHGASIALANVRANAAGTGNAMIDVAAPVGIAVNGVLDVQAADAGKRADMKLVSDRLDYNGAAPVLSNGNGHVQLAPFSTNLLIGVHDSKDFDAVPMIDYPQAQLQKFIGHQAEVSFGGEYDRSDWANSNPSAFCVPCMDNWSSKLQQTADIHVAANGHLDLGDVKMVFDTAGTTYYHDNHMSPWSVPSGRVAIFRARPNVDRYLDRTDNTLQTMTKAVEHSSFNSANPALGSGGPMSGSTQIGGNLFMAGNGVNTGAQAAFDNGSNANGFQGDAVGGSGRTPGAASTPSADGSQPAAGLQRDGQAQDESDELGKKARTQ